MSTPARQAAPPRPASPPPGGRRPAAGRSAGGPMGGMGMPAEKAMTFKPSAKRLLRRLRARSARKVVAVLALAVVSVGFAVIGPKLLGRATDIIFAGVLGRRLPAGITDAAGGRRGPGRGPRQHRRPAARLGRRPRPGHRLRRARHRAALGARALRGVVGVQLAAGLPAQRRRAAHRAAGCAPTSRTSSTGCRCATSTSSRAASCSAASPTTSTTSSQTPAADDEPAAHLAAHGGRRAGDDVRRSRRCSR